MLKVGLAVDSACTLCRIPSLFRTLNGWPTMIPITCGLYWQPFWSMTTGSVGAGQVLPAGSPLTTRTSTLAIVLPVPSTSISFGIGRVLLRADRLGRDRDRLQVRNRGRCRSRCR